MPLLTAKPKQIDAQQALDNAVEWAQSKSGVVADTWALISIASSLNTIAKKLK